MADVACAECSVVAEVKLLHKPCTAVEWVGQYIGVVRVGHDLD
jgi:hypothetical protein